MTEAEEKSLPCMPGHPESRCRVLIVNDDPVRGRDIASQVHDVCQRAQIMQAVSAGEATQTYRAGHPDIVLIGAQVQGFDGSDLTKLLLKERHCAVVMLSERGDAELIDRAVRAGVFGFLVGPITPEGLQAQMAVAVHRCADYESALRQKDELATALEARKLIERAKGIYMRKFGLDEPQAHRQLQSESQARRLPLGEHARKVIQAEADSKPPTA